MSIHAEPDERSGKRLGARLACAQRHKKARSAERALISWWRWGDSGFSLREKAEPSLASSVGRNAKNMPLACFCPAGRVSTSSVQVPLLTWDITKTGPLLDMQNCSGGVYGT